MYCAKLKKEINTMLEECASCDLGFFYCLFGTEEAK